jgi:hypothetical protein
MSTAVKFVTFMSNGVFCENYSESLIAFELRTFIEGLKISADVLCSVITVSR